jgi:hypothetical protein
VKRQFAIRSEEELRKAAEQQERARVRETLPQGKPEPTPDPEVVALRDDLKNMTEEMSELKTQVATRSETDLRKAAERQERERVKETLPAGELAPEPDPEVVELRAELRNVTEQMSELQTKVDTRSEAELRKAAERAERERVKAELPEGGQVPDPAVEALRSELSAAHEQMEDMRRQLETRSESELRKDAERLERERVRRELPPAELGDTLKDAETEVRLLAARLLNQMQHASASSRSKRLISDLRETLDAAGAERFGSGADRFSYVEDFDPDAGWVIYYISGGPGQRYVRVAYATTSEGAVQLGTEETEVVRTTSYRPKAEAVKSESKEPVRARDSLRERSEQTVLEIQSGGVSLRKPPNEPKQEPKPEPIDEVDLRRRSRDTMLELLTGENA